MAKRRALHAKQHSLRKKQPSPETVRADGTVKNKLFFDDLLRRYYWLIGTAMIALTVAVMVVELRPLSFRPFNGPFYGLHSWARATGSWSARSHAHYGLGYTKGFTTWAVGDPPTENPKRYVDHPQLPTLLMGGVMAIFGANDWTPQLVRIITTVIGMLILLKVLRELFEEKTALLAMLFLGLLPLMGYFGVGGWLFVITSWALWRYLILIESLSDGPSPKTRHLVEFAIALFLMVQLNWSGLFYAFTFGLHYVLRCVFRRGKLHPAVLVILIVMPLTSLAMNFAVMRAGYGGETQKIFDLYKWRATKDEGGNIQAGQWFSTLKKHSVSNFTWPVLVLLIGHCGYLLAGRVVLFFRGASPGGRRPRRTGPRGGTDGTSSTMPDKPRLPRDFPQIWLFLLPGVILLIVFRGLVREHQYWLRPFAPFVAISASLGLMMIADILRKIHRRAALAGVIAGVIIVVVFCTRGLAAYRQIRWQSPRTI
ncbi:MAG: glycosyltransferase family 39 protein [Sedimentisphaerales bacterium]|nr:glycosyltransferase family 39 protein [Sedimentisphaerales bacterium]